MSSNTYTGWEIHGRKVAVLCVGGRIVSAESIVELKPDDPSTPIDWGTRSSGSLILARLILWSATWDCQLVDDLAEMFHDEITSKLGTVWDMTQETVRNWIQQHQPYRDLMHGRDPMRNCPGCG